MAELGSIASFWRSTRRRVFAFSSPRRNAETCKVQWGTSSDQKRQNLSRFSTRESSTQHPRPVLSIWQFRCHLPQFYTLSKYPRAPIANTSSRFVSRVVLMFLHHLREPTRPRWRNNFSVSPPHVLKFFSYRDLVVLVFSVAPCFHLLLIISLMTGLVTKLQRFQRAHSWRKSPIFLRRIPRLSPFQEETWSWCRSEHFLCSNLFSVLQISSICS